MHYRNGREAKNGDKIVKLEGGKVVSFGVLHSAIPGNDYCNGNIAPVQHIPDSACLSTAFTSRISPRFSQRRVSTSVQRASDRT